MEWPAERSVPLFFLAIRLWLCFGVFLHDEVGAIWLPLYNQVVPGVRVAFPHSVSIGFYFCLVPGNRYFNVTVCASIRLRFGKRHCLNQQRFPLRAGQFHRACKAVGITTVGANHCTVRVQVCHLLIIRITQLNVLFKKRLRDALSVESAWTQIDTKESAMIRQV